MKELSIYLFPCLKSFIGENTSKVFHIFQENIADLYFLGLTDHVTEGKWVCEGTGQVIITTTGQGTGGPMFHSTEPKSGNAQRCVDLCHVDYLCNTRCSNMRYFICEIP